MKIDRPTGPQAPDGQSPVGEAGRAGEPAVSFAETLGKTEGADPTAAVAATGVDALVERMRAGEIGIDAVLDALVEQSVQAAPLGPQGKQELREILRAALENDPTLRRLAREIEQG